MSAEASRGGAGGRVPDAAVAQLREEGYAVVPGFLDTDELEKVRAGLWLEHVRPEAYFEDPSAYPQYAEGQFAGLKRFPYASPDLNRLAFHPGVVDMVERFLGSSDVELYQIDLWGKYAGAVDYEQSHHCDYNWRSMVVPRRDGWRPQVSIFFLLSDVTEDSGPTKVVPAPHTRDEPLVPPGKEPGAFGDVEIPITGPAGTIFAFRTDVFHRGTSITGEGRSRFVLIAGYQERGAPWAGGNTWSEHGHLDGFRAVLEQASPRERELFGFPPVGHEYWDDQTVADVQLRYPNMDMTPYRESARSGQ